MAMNVGVEKNACHPESGGCRIKTGDIIALNILTL
jgi:hypothetical protein